MKKKNKLISSNIIDKGAILLFEQLYDIYETQYGIVDDVAIHIINDICLIEQRKNQYNEDIDKRGVMIEWKNGENQCGQREHPLLKEIPKLIEQQRKLLGELKLTPSSLKIMPKNTEAERQSDEFEQY